MLYHLSAVGTNVQKKTAWGVALSCLTALVVSCDNHSDFPDGTGHWNDADIPDSMQCASCHPKQFRQWVASDHAWAARPPQPAWENPAFNGKTSHAHGATLFFSSPQPGRYQVHSETQKPPFPIITAVGRDPLVQYTVPGERGAQQVLSSAWDPAAQEWFDVFEDDARLKKEGMAKRAPGDWGHWTGRGMTWNSQCAACHMTDYKKRYDRLTDTYHSTCVEPGITCIACHPAATPDPIDDCTAERRTRSLTEQQTSAVCASCHARAERLDDDFRPGDRFEDHYRLELPVAPGVFYANGMQRDEDFVETGFRLSRMGAAGVTCLDCHDAHTGDTILPWEDNSLCLRCHANGKVINGKKAPFSEGAPKNTCDRNSIGGRCVECHMPESRYMARDPRRDHSLNIPDPVLSIELGIPNACTMCHSKMSDQWAAEVLAHAIPHQIMEARRPRTRAIHAAMHGRPSEKDLLNALHEETIPAWRATLLEHLARCPISPDIRQAAQLAAADPDALVRAAAAGIPGEHVLPMLNDSARTVRHAAAWCLLVWQPELLRGTRALKELRATAEFLSDQPGGIMQLATLALIDKREDEAESLYRRAIELDPASPVPYMDYAVLLARQNRLPEALQQLLICTSKAPLNAEAQYRLALALIELRQYPAALTALNRALQADPGHVEAGKARASLLPMLSPQTKQ